MGQKIDFFPLNKVSPTQTKMPSKRGSKVNASAKRENEKAIRTLYVNPEAYLFARIDASLGAGGFRIVLNDSTIVTGIPRGLFNPRTFRINVGDVVLIEACDNKSNRHQIIAKLSQDEVKQFYNNKMISEAVFRKPDVSNEKEEDEKWEFDDESDDDSEIDLDKI